MSPFSSSTPTARCSTCMRRSRVTAAQAGPDADRMSEIWRTKQLEYSWTLTLAGHYTDFWTLTERALDFALARVPSGRQGAQAEAARRLFQARCFSRRARGAAALKAKGHKTGILSNGSPDMLKGAVDGGCDRRRSRCGAFGRCAENVQAAAGGLSPRHRSFQMQAGRRHFRVVQPLGRDGGRLGRLPRPVGQSRQDAGRISGFPAGADAERPECTERIA